MGHLASAAVCTQCSFIQKLATVHGLSTRSVHERSNLLLVQATAAMSVDGSTAAMRHAGYARSQHGGCMALCDPRYEQVGMNNGSLHKWLHNARSLGTSLAASAVATSACGGPTPHESSRLARLQRCSPGRPDEQRDDLALVHGLRRRHRMVTWHHHQQCRCHKRARTCAAARLPLA